MRVGITLACSECKQRNYTTTKDKKNTPRSLKFVSIANSAMLIRFTKKSSNSGDVKTCVQKYTRQKRRRKS